MILASPSPIGMALGLATAVVYGATAVGADRLSRQHTQSLLGLAWLLHGAALLWAMGAAPVRFGFAPALSVTAWLVLTVYLIESRLYPQMRARWTLAILGMAVVLLALAVTNGFLKAKNNCTVQCGGLSCAISLGP